MSCTTAAALRYSRTTAVHSSSTVRVRLYESTVVAAVLGLYCRGSTAVLDRAPAAELYESCSTAVLVLVLGIPTAVGELTY